MIQGIARQMDILLVEDNPGDVRLVTEALQQGEARNRLWVVYNGVEALEFLRRQGRHTSAPIPDIVLLDLNLPGKNGREVLAEIRADDCLKHTVVCVLTSSTFEDDICFCYRNHANCYVVKPIDLEHYLNAIKMIEKFWLNAATLPPKECRCRYI